MATLDYPGWGYGIRYKYGMFKQVRARTLRPVAYACVHVQRAFNTAQAPMTHVASAQSFALQGLRSNALSVYLSASAGTGNPGCRQPHNLT